MHAIEKAAKRVIRDAERDGLEIDSSNVEDLLCDNLLVPCQIVPNILQGAGLEDKFPDYMQRNN